MIDKQCCYELITQEWGHITTHSCTHITQTTTRQQTDLSCVVIVYFNFVFHSICWRHFICYKCYWIRAQEGISWDRWRCELIKKLNYTKQSTNVLNSTHSYTQSDTILLKLVYCLHWVDLYVTNYCIHNKVSWPHIGNELLS